jgi:N-acyl-D-aspartate/D-glutamate deacylase
MLGSDAILEPNNNNHPRSTGCMTRTLGRFARDQQVLSLMDALSKMTIMPARRLEHRAPALRTKGRLQRGADADITIFDPATVIDTSTVANPAQYAVGVDTVIVLGQVVKDGNGINHDVRPGQPVAYGA